MDALTLLQSDHDQLKAIMAQLEKTTRRAVKKRANLFNKLEHDLRIHEQIEEAVLYPALMNAPKAKDLALEAFEEHDFVDTIVAEIDETPVESDAWHAKFVVMKENVEHHIQEEEGQLFPKARQAFDQSELDDLGARMQAIKQADHPARRPDAA